MYGTLLGTAHEMVVNALEKMHAVPKKQCAEWGKPAVHWHAAVAGAIGGYVVWSGYTSINYQIVLYLLSRILIACVSLAAKKGIMPFTMCTFSKVYPVLAVSLWATVMWLFENAPESLHPSLKRSMDFLYHDSNTWKEGVMDFLPSPATAIVCAAIYFKW